MRICPCQPAAMSVVQNLRAHFETIGGARDDLAVTTTVCKKPRPIFQRSKTSLQLTPPKISPRTGGATKTQSYKVVPKNPVVASNNLKNQKNSSSLLQQQFSRHTDDSKRASIKRSPAFRELRHKNAVHRTSSTPAPQPLVEIGESQLVEEAIRRNPDVNLTDTLKKALSQPLPSGPPPKKPPRAFEIAVIAGSKIEAIQVNNNKATVRQVTSDKISTFVDQNFLGCFNCVNKDPIYDLVPFEPIYMEPTLSRRPSKECAERHDGNSGDDLHYMVSRGPLQYFTFSTLQFLNNEKAYLSIFALIDLYFILSVFFCSETVKWPLRAVCVVTLIR